ncbi:signal peptidase I [Bradyrhizobium sp.]|uniref:signal peptidase I n=1 Tax=Bradyrhizobium sp. TaxID=376 RepID=UPI004037FB5D
MVVYAVLALAVTIGALSLPLLIRAYLFQPFNIPAGSMIPTLLVGDYFFVSKYAYAGVSGTGPARGDVVAFLLPKDNSTVYIKRVVGLPGDRIQIKEGMLHINGAAVARERLPDYVGEDPCGGDGKVGTKRWRETLPNGVSYETLDCVDVGFYDNTNVYTVPDGRIFMLGDNRDNSSDSRVMSQVGYVPLANLVGRAGMIFFSRDAGGRGGPAGIRWGRIGTLVR